MRKLISLGNDTCEIREAPVLDPAPGQVLIRTRVSALCGSELKAYHGKGLKNGNTGHEAVGEVAAVGAGVDSIEPGTRVGVSAIAGCGDPECPECRLGQSTYCPNHEFYGGMHSEYFITVPSACIPLPEDISDEVAVLISGDGLGVPYHTNMKLDETTKRSIAVFGCGPIGLGTVLLQSFLGREVLAVDVVQERVDLARSLGAAHVLNGAEKDPVKWIHSIVGQAGCDVAIDAAGTPETVRHCFRSVRIAGTVVFNGEQKEVTLSPSGDFIRRDITAVGSWFFQVGEFPAMLRLYRRGLQVEKLITHTLSFEEAPRAFELFVGRKTGKVLLKYE